MTSRLPLLDYILDMQRYVDGVLRESGKVWITHCSLKTEHFTLGFPTVFHPRTQIQFQAVIPLVHTLNSNNKSFNNRLSFLRRDVD
jgi:hypothetical protein